MYDDCIYSLIFYSAIAGLAEWLNVFSYRAHLPLHAMLQRRTAGKGEVGEEEI